MVQELNIKFTNNKLFLSVQYIEDGIPPDLIYVDYTIKN